VAVEAVNVVGEVFDLAGAVLGFAELGGEEVVAGMTGNRHAGGGGEGRAVLAVDDEVGEEGVGGEAVLVVEKVEAVGNGRADEVEEGGDGGEDRGGAGVLAEAGVAVPRG
jgi:hypothetical protein